MLAPITPLLQLAVCLAILVGPSLQLPALRDREQKPDVLISDARSIVDKTEKESIDGVTKDYEDDLFIDDNPAEYRVQDAQSQDQGAPFKRGEDLGAPLRNGAPHDQVQDDDAPLGSGVSPSVQTLVHTPSTQAFTFQDDTESQAGYSDDSIADLGSGQAMNKLTTTGTKCQLLRSRAMAGSQVFYTPECEPNGDYKPLQCKDNQCWCVHVDGRAIPYTRQRVTDTMPDCDRQTGSKGYRTNEKPPTKPASELTVLTTLTSRTTTPLPTLAQKKQASYWLFMRTDILAGIFVGTGVGLICAVVLVICIVHRMKKKDEGSYALDEPRPPPPCQQPYQRAPTKEVYA